MKWGVAAGVEHERLLAYLGCRTIVDVGANRGQFTLAAMTACPSARIIAFEPLPSPARVFRRVIDGQRRVTLHEIALGSARGEAVMHVSRRDDSSSLLPIGPAQRSLFPGTGEVGTACVPVARLCDVVAPEALRAPTLLKVDVQGYELEVLKGCREVIESIDFVYAECSFVELYRGQALAAEVIAWLKESGLHLAALYNAVSDGHCRVIQGDLLFMRTVERP